MVKRKDYCNRILSIALMLCMMAAFVPVVSATERIGIRVVYDFESENYGPFTGNAGKTQTGIDIKEIDYEDSFGRMEYYGTNSTKTSAVKYYPQDPGGNDKCASIALNVNEYVAFRIKIPKQTKYQVRATYVWRNDGAIMDICFLTGSEIKNEVFTNKSFSFIKLDTTKSSNSGLTAGTTVTKIAEKSLDTTADSDSLYAGEDEIYISVTRNGATDGSNTLYLKSIELLEVDENGELYDNYKTVPMYGKVGLGATVLGKKADTTTVNTTNVYLSDGTATSDLTGITYTSSDETVATIENGKVVAEGVGTATISACYGDFVIDSAEIDVAATDEDGTPTKEKDDTPEIVSQSVKMLTTVLGDETTSSSIPEAVAIVDGYATVTADAEDRNGNKFLYWAKGLQTGAGVKVLSTNRENYRFKPSNGANYIIAVYGKPSEEYTPKYFNANGQPLEDGNTLPSMPGYGTAKGFKDCGFGVYIAEYDPANEVTYTITENNHGTANAYSKKFGDEVSVTADDASEGEYFRFWKKKAADGAVEIVSFDRTYTFYAFESCELTAVYSKYAQDALTDTFRKIILTNLGETQYMAEFIGFGDAVEKGISIGGQRISMTTDKTQFTLDTQTTEGVKGYAIDGNGNVYYAD